MRYVLAILLLIFTLPRGLSQTIYVEHTGDDATGQRFAFALKEAIRRSHAYTLADVKGKGVSVTMTSVPITVGGETIGSAVAVDLSVDPTCVCPASVIPLSQWALVVRNSSAEDTANSMLAAIDHSLSEVKSLFSPATPNAHH